MYLERLELENVRCVEAAELELSPRFNLLLGPNGSGKTSCLEAVFVLSTGRSFRSGRGRELIRRGQPCLRSRGVVVDDAGDRHRVGVERSGSGMRARVDGADVRQAARLAKGLLVAVVEPDCQRLLTDGADLRRRLLDWIMFHVERDYGAVHVRYRRALRQRNALLRSESGSAMHAWDVEVAEVGEALAGLRARHLPGILAGLGEILSALVRRPIQFEYEPGFAAGEGLAASLASASRRDQALGYTSVGPHRCDLRLESDGVAVQNVLSRGESKLTAASLVVAQALYVRETTGQRPVVLVDDLGSELDAQSRSRLFEALATSECQVLVTSVAEMLVTEAPSESTRVFHVEQGRVHEVIE